MKRDVLIASLIAILSIIALWWSSSYLSSVIIFIPGVIISFLIYLKTYSHSDPIPGTLLPIYLLALAIQFIHFTEEYLTDFIIELPKLMGSDPYSLDFWIVFNMIAYSIFVLGGIIIFKKKRELMIIPIFFILVGVVFNGIAHIGLAIYKGGYFPGLYSALVYVMISPVIINRLFKIADPATVA